MAEHTFQESPAESYMQLVKRRLLFGGAWAFGGKIFTGFLALATNVLLARLLTPAELGAYFLAFSVVLFGMQVGSLGLNRAVVRFVAENMGLDQPGRAKKSATVAVALGTGGALLVGTAYMMSGSFIGESIFDSPVLAAVSGLVAGWIIVMTLQLLLSEVFRGFHDIRLAILFGGSGTGLGLITGGLLCGSLLLLWIAEGGAELKTILLLALASGLASTLLAGWLLRRKLFALPNPEGAETPGATQLLRTSSPMLATNLLTSLSTRAPLWVVGAFFIQQQVALYGAALKLVPLVAMPLAIVNSVVPPLIAELYSQDRMRELERALRGTAAIAGMSAFAFLGAYIIFGGPILAMVFGDYYGAAFPILALLSLGRLAKVWSGSWGVTLMMTGHQRLLMWLSMIISTLMVGGAILVANYSGAVGVAAVVAAGMALQNAAMVLVTRTVTGMWTHAGFRGIPKMLRAYVSGQGLSNLVGRS